MTEPTKRIVVGYMEPIKLDAKLSLAASIALHDAAGGYRGRGLMPDQWAGSAVHSASGGVVGKTIVSGVGVALRKDTLSDE